MNNEKFIYDEDFVNLGKLLKKDTDSMKYLKSLLDKESEYVSFLGAVEFSIGEGYIENTKLKDKDVIRMVKNVRNNYFQNLDFFSEDIERGVLLRLSAELQDRKSKNNIGKI